MSEPGQDPQGAGLRFLRLVIAPTLAALVPWLVLDLGNRDPGGLLLVLIAAVPLVGGLTALSYSFRAPVRTWLLVPLIVAAAVFLFVLLVASGQTSGNKLDFGPAQAIGVILSLVAMIGGVLGCFWLPELQPDDLEPETAS